MSWYGKAGAYAIGAMRAGGGIGGRVAAGAAIGGWMGRDKGAGGFFGGMAAGGLAGALGPMAGRKLMGMNNYGGATLRDAMGWLGKQSAGMTSNAAFIRSMRPDKMASAAALGLSAAGRMTNHANTGRIVMGMGMASAGMIGSSMLGSNRGY